MKLEATGVAIKTATSTDNGGFAAATPAEVATIATTAKAELSQLTKPKDQADWKATFHKEMTALANKPENSGVRGQIDKMLKSLGCNGLGEAPAATGWKMQGSRGHGVREVATVQAPTLSELPKLPTLTGDVTLKDGKAFMKQGDKEIELVQANNNINPPLYPSWAASSFVDDGPVTVRGTLGSDGKFRVDDMCPGSSNQYTYGRVDKPSADAGKVVLKTARGDVEVINPELKELLLRAPNLGMILPGDPKLTADGKMVYDQNPQAYYVLGGRAKETPEGPNKHTKYTEKVEGQPGKYTTKEEMAYSYFLNKPVYMDDNSAQRLDYNVRSLMLGTFTMSDDRSSLESFNAFYIGKNPENRSMQAVDPQATAMPPDQATSRLSQQGFRPPRYDPLDQTQNGFLWRNKPPAPVVPAAAPAEQAPAVQPQ